MAPGFYDLPFEEYLRTPAISSHALMDILISPKMYHYRHIRGIRKVATPAMKFGTLVHKAILEPAEFLKHYRVDPKPDRRTKEGKAQAADFEASLTPQSIVITQAESDTLLGMIESLRSHERASALLQKGVSEQSGYWTHKSGRKCRIRPDFLTENGVLVDLKTTKDAGTDSFERDTLNYQYNLQMAFYVDGIKAITGKDVQAVILAIEKLPPFDLVLHVPNATVLESGRILYERAIRLLDQCEKSGKWPGKNDKFVELALPHWAINNFDYDEDEDA